jgi:hypothetical protein
MVTISGPTDTATGAEVNVQLPNVSCTVYVPEVATTIDCVVAFVDQRYESAGAAVSVTLPPWQNVVGPLAVIEAAASVTIADALLLQPSDVTVTE